MTKDTTETKELLRMLVGSIVDHPQAVRIEAQEAGAACYWMLQGDPRDESKLIGKGGSHVRAIEDLLTAIGRASGVAYTFRLLTTSEPRERRPEAPRDVLQYDPEPARELLTRILQSLDLGTFAVEVGPGAGPRRSLTFVFTIRTTESVDFNLLMRPTPPSNEPLIAGLGTLFRAIAKKAGVRFAVNVA